MASINEAKRQAGRLRSRARKLLVLALLTAAASIKATHARGQTFAEWFEQKKTQKKYLLDQIAALEAYRSVLSQGYREAKGGLTSISGSLQSEFDLHNQYYDRLNTASPAVKNNKQLQDILEWQNDILQQVQKFRKAAGLTSDEKNYVEKVSTALLQDCADQMNALENIISDNQLKMSDQERISGLDKIYTSMQDNYRFAADFAARLKLLVLKRKELAGEAATERSYYHLSKP